MCYITSNCNFCRWPGIGRVGSKMQRICCVLWGIGGVCGNWKYVQNFVGELSEEHLFTTSRRLIFEKQGDRLWCELNWNWVGLYPVVDWCISSSETSGCLIRELLDCWLVINCKFLNWNMRNQSLEKISSLICCCCKKIGVFVACIIGSRRKPFVIVY